ncbi:MAG: flavin reductase family protein [Candidatus Lutacidiplasmatales archaeon]
MSEPQGTVDPRAFRRLMGRWATGVTVVTTSDGDFDAGLTVNSFLSVSLRPPLLLVSLAEDTEATPVIVRTRKFAVSVLSADQRALSERFGQAIPPAEKFRDVPIRRGELGLPLLVGATATFECRVVEAHPAADHLLVLGEVVRAEAGDDASPLLFFRSRYADRRGADGLTLAPPPPP